MEYDKSSVAQLAKRLGIAEIPDDWSGVGPVFPLLEAMREDGAVVIVKLDGERDGTEEEPFYTLVVSSGPLGDAYIREETSSLDDGLCLMIGRYSSRVWH